MKMYTPTVRKAMDAGLPYDMAWKYNEYVQRKERTIKRGRSAFKDSSQSKVYRAESAFQICWEKAGYEWPVLDKKQVEKKLASILKSKLWQEIAGGKKITLSWKKDMGDRSAYWGMAWPGHIQLCPRYGATLHVLLHELAHCAGNPHHDVTFRQDYVKLVSRFWGREAASLLKICFKEAGLKMSIKKNIKTPEQWYASYLKMKKLRAANSK
ncbi:MAG: hypothetical protein EBY41_00125 [Proteobacteria bacterium]|nr:hypothetical protein [Pseudomonadota bacterium]